MKPQPGPLKVRADLILQALRKRHKDRQNPDVFLTEVKNGPTQVASGLLKLDALAIARSWAHPCLTGYEIKVDRRDFLRDTKYPQYMEYCNKFAFVCPTGLIAPEDLPDPTIGLIHYNPETGALSTRKAAVYRPIQIPEHLLMYIAMYRTVDQPHPFFSNRREYLEAWLLDKEQKRDLGYVVGSKLAKEVARLEEEIEDRDKKIARLESEKKQLDEIKEILEAHGIKVSWWNSWKEELTERLTVGVDEKTKNLVRSMLEKATELNMVINP